MLGGQAIGEVHPALGAQAGQHVAIFVFMVLRAGEVEVAQHITRRVLGLCVSAAAVHMGLQAQQQVQAAPHALVAGGQHLEGLVEADRRAGMQGEAGAHAQAL